MRNNPFDERRTVTRHEVHVPIEVSNIGRGQTIDISSNGVAFVLDQLLSPGVPITFRFALSAGGVVLHCEGQVVRAEPLDKGAFTAATIDNIAFDATEH